MQFTLERFVTIHGRIGRVIAGPSGPNDVLQDTCSNIESRIVGSYIVRVRLLRFVDLNDYPFKIPMFLNCQRIIFSYSYSYSNFSFSDQGLGALFAFRFSGVMTSNSGSYHVSVYVIHF
jgi:hypothetical protein